MDEDFRPESRMMTFGYKPAQASGSIKPPIYQTSTFSFSTAEEAKDFFAYVHGEKESLPEGAGQFLYSRLGNPNLEIAEKRLCLWDEAEECALFDSGMAAISTVMLSILRPGDVLLYSAPLYSGTDIFINQVLFDFGIKLIAFHPNESREEILSKIDLAGAADKLAMIYVETPVNPNNQLLDIEMCSDLARHFEVHGKSIKVAVDNTYMGPLWQQPLKHGADLVVYSATKYIGGHSDLIAGAVLGKSTLLKEIKMWRNNLGNTATPFTGWLISRSLETMKLRMEKQQENAILLSQFLSAHSKIEKVYYLGLLREGDEGFDIFAKQCCGNGAMMAFDIKGGEPAVFKFLNALKLVKIAVSLGSTESLAQHPYSMTHSGVDPSHRDALGISEKLVRFSVGIENADDLVQDLKQALL